MARHRMLLSLDDDLHNKLKELSQLTGTPAARFVYELLKLSEQNIDSIINALKLVKEQKPALALDQLNEALTKSMHIGTTTQVDIIQEKKKFSAENKQ